MYDSFVAKNWVKEVRSRIKNLDEMSNVLVVVNDDDPNDSHKRENRKGPRLLSKSHAVIEGQLS